MRRELWKPAACGLALLLAAGCARLNVEQSLTVGAHAQKSLIIDASSREQNVQVHVTAATPVGVYCFLEKDQSDAERAVTLHVASPKILASAEKSTAADLEFTVPANNPTVVLVSNADDQSVTAQVKITGR
jgi:hypothetical protein